MDRDCTKCIHHISGSCSVWDCEMETLEEHDAKVRADAIDDAIHHLDNSKVNCHEDYVDGIDFAIGVLRSIAEQLKE